jgi:hypothetical protein
MASRATGQKMVNRDLFCFSMRLFKVRQFSTFLALLFKRLKHSTNAAGSERNS